MRIVVDENKIEGFQNVTGYKGEMSVITFLKNRGRWTVGSSMCLPSDMIAALQIQECVAAAFTALKEVVLTEPPK